MSSVTSDMLAQWQAFQARIDAMSIDEIAASVSDVTKRPVIIRLPMPGMDYALVMSQKGNSAILCRTMAVDSFYYLRIDMSGIPSRKLCMSCICPSCLKTSSPYASSDSNDSQELLARLYLDALVSMCRSHGIGTVYIDHRSLPVPHGHYKGIHVALPTDANCHAFKFLAQDCQLHLPPDVPRVDSGHAWDG